MMTRDKYAEWKRIKIEQLEIEAEICERQLEAIQMRIVCLEEETFEEAIGDARYDEWKAKRHEI